jgi:AcrR family transcriptional regulator
MLVSSRGVEAQRMRLLDAAVQVTADKGYAAATVADLVRAAGVSRSTFYELYAGKEACFLDAYRRGVDLLGHRVAASVRAAEGDWRAELRAGVRAYLDALAAEPRWARAYLIEVHMAGPAALDVRTEALRRFADRYRATAARAGRTPHPDALLVLCAGTEQLVAERVRAGGEGADLRDLEDVFCECAEAVLAGGADDEGGRPKWT